MLTDRQLDIFKSIVDEFVLTAEPVGSKTLMQKYSLPYSSATIRNDMQYLEEIGYLEKTHTSSGRVPSSLGYKFYCEHCLESKVDKKMELTIQSMFDSNHVNMDDAIMMSCNILSQMTNLTSGVLGPGSSHHCLEHIKLFPIDKRSAVCVLITDSGHTENKTFQFNDDLSLDDVTNCCNILNDRLRGTRIENVVEKMQSLRPILAEHVIRHEMLFQAFLKAFTKFASDNVYFSGTDKLLYQPEFADVEKIKGLMKMLDDRTMWRQLTNQTQEIALKTHDGCEMVWLDDVAVVSSKFRLSDKEEGKLMVLGPSRMDYERVTTLLDMMAAMIEKIYGKDE